MAERRLESSELLSKADRRLILAAKIFVLLVVAGVLASGKDPMWPLVNWPMFSTYGDNPPSAERSAVQVHVIGEGGQTIILWDKDLSWPMPSGDGVRVVQLAFDIDDATQRRATYRAIWSRVGAILPTVRFTELQVWKVFWNNVDSRQSPPFDAQRPDERTLLGTIRAADLEDAP